MLIAVSISLTALAALVYAVYFYNARSTVHGSRLQATKIRLPDGPTCFPLVGSSYVFCDGVANTIHRLAKRYGPLLTIYAFKKPCICINDFDLIAKVATCDGYQDRPNFPRIAQLCGTLSRDNNGLLFSSGETWRQHRKFATQFMRGHGMGKRSGDLICHAEARRVLENFEIKCKFGKDFDPSHIITVSSANVLTNVLGDSTTSLGDEKQISLFINVLASVLHNDSSAILIPLLLESYPWLSHLPLPGILKLISDTSGLATGFDALIKERQSYGTKANNNDIIDSYIKTMADEKCLRFNKNLSVQNLLWMIVDLYIAGTDTTSAVILQAIRFLAVDQDLQGKIFKETQDTKNGDILSYSCLKQMPQTSAFIAEILRFHPPVPCAIPRMASRDGLLDGKLIPKGAVIICNIYGAQRDPNHWKDPNSFKPQRFLNEAGQYVKKEKMLPFSLGKHRCAGEALALAEVTIFISSMVKHFKILPPKNSTINMSTKRGLISSPVPFKIRVQRRICA